VTAAGRPADIRALLLDIEGTTTPISFVVDTLFGYARRHVEHYVAQHAAEAGHADLFARLGDEHAADSRAGQPVPPWADAPTSAHAASIVSYVEWLMDRDRKSTALKELQGLMWEDGYRRGELAGTVFPDVPEALARWRAQGLSIAIFSSGSVLAQQWLFRTCPAGDLTKFLQRYFDTTTGPKTDAESYRRIAVAMGVPVQAVLFVSDVTRELDAARSAGMQTRLTRRPGNPEPGDCDHAVIETFDDL
jgi:enolase-phosphatase E1